MLSSPLFLNDWLNQYAQTLLQVIALASVDDVVAENW